MPLDTPICLTFTYQYEDFFPTRRKRARGPGFPWVSVLGWALVGAVAVMMFVVFSNPRKVGEVAQPRESIDEVQIVMWGVCIAGVVYSIVRARVRAKLTWTQQEPVTVTISPEGLVWERDTSRTEERWATYQSFTENDRGFTLTGKSRGATFFPRRVVPADRLEDFRAMCKAGTKPVLGFPVEMTPRFQEHAGD